jgi:hypothetical protein
MLSIAKPSIWPPGGYSYVQPDTGRRFDGNTPLTAQAYEISRYRLGNSLARSSVEECLEDLVAYTCARLPGICVQNSGRAISAGRTPVATAIRLQPKLKPYTAAPARIAMAAPRVSKPCGSCGGRKR